MTYVTTGSIKVHGIWDEIRYTVDGGSEIIIPSNQVIANHPVIPEFGTLVFTGTNVSFINAIGSEFLNTVFIEDVDPAIYGAPAGDSTHGFGANYASNNNLTSFISTAYMPLFDPYQSPLGGFYNCTSLTHFEFNADGITSFQTYFRDIDSPLTTFEIYNAGAVTNWTWAFSYSTSITNLDNVDFSGAVDCTLIFAYSGLESFPSLMNMSDVVDASGMFAFSLIKTVPDISLPKATNVDSIFYSTSLLTRVGNLSLPVALNMDNMFTNSPLLVCIEGLDTTNATDKTTMFDGTPALEHPTAAEQVDLMDLDGAVYSYDCTLFDVTLLSTGTISISITGNNLKHNGVDITSGTDKILTGTSHHIEGEDVTLFRTEGGAGNIYQVITDAHIEGLSQELTSMLDIFAGQQKLVNMTVSSASVTRHVTNMANAWWGCVLMTSFPMIDTSNVTDMNSTWSLNLALTAFPAIDTGNVSNFSNTWHRNESLTSFPIIDVSGATELNATWSVSTDYGSPMTTFPLIDTSTIILFNDTWAGQINFTSFPAIDTSNATSLRSTWDNCESLVSFPAIDTSGVINMFSTWGGCTNLECLSSLDTTSLVSDNSGTLGTFYECPALIQPPASGSSVRAGVNSVIGGTWTNPGVCGPVPVIGGMKIGTEDITNPYVGSEPVNKVMLGDMLVWERV